MTPPLGTFEWQRLIRGLNLPRDVNNVAGWICSFGEQDGTRIYPGIAKLMLATGLSRAATVEALSALRESGLLRRVQRGGGRSSRKSDEYELSVPDGELTIEEHERKVADAYEAAGRARRERERLRYTNRGASIRMGRERVETNSGIPDTNSGIPLTNGGAATAPTRDHQPVKHHADIDGLSGAVAEVEVSGEPRVQDLEVVDKSARRGRPSPRGRAGTEAERKHQADELTAWEARQPVSADVSAGIGTDEGDLHR